MTELTVIKRNLQGEEMWRYSAVLTRREGTAIHLEAHFNGKDAEFMGVTIRRGDPFVEIYYTDRWYNIFEIHDRDDRALKGWYCNIGFPAVITDRTVSYVDLALDLWVSPDGKQTVLDEEEFRALKLGAAERRQARRGLRELQQLFKKSTPPD